MNHVPKEEMNKFFNPEHWITYFPAFGKSDLETFGIAVDFRWAFITTSYNPYYDSFI